jgi:TonB family C-terminal domain
MFTKNPIFSLLVFLTIVYVAAISGYGQSEPTQNQGQSDRPLKIKKKPFGNPRGCDVGTSGTIRVRVTFLDSGTVGDVVAVDSSGCPSFDESAIKAAKKIVFEPAVKNGTAVTVTKLVVYNFQIR